MKEQKQARARQIHSSRGNSESHALNICFLLEYKARVVFMQTVREERLMEKQVSAQPVVAGLGQWQCFALMCTHRLWMLGHVCVDMSAEKHTGAHTHTNTHTPCMHISTLMQLNHTWNSGWFQGQYGEFPLALFFNPASLNSATLMRLTN